MRPEEQESTPIKERSALMQKALNTCDAIRDKALETAKYGIRLTEVFGKKIQENKKIAYPLIASLALTTGIVMAGNPDTYMGTIVDTNNVDSSTVPEVDDLDDEVIQHTRKEKMEAEMKQQIEAQIKENRSLVGFKKVLSKELQDLNIATENTQLAASATDENVVISELGPIGTRYDYFLDKDKKPNKEPDYLFVHDIDDNNQGGFSQTRLKVDAKNKVVEYGQQVSLTDDEVAQRRAHMFPRTDPDNWRITSEGNQVLEAKGDFMGLEIKTKITINKNGVVETSSSIKKVGQANPIAPNMTVRDDEENENP